MNYYELIFEDGTYSVTCAESDEAVLPGIQEIQRRAVNALPAVGTADWEPNAPPPSRVKRVLVYPDDPTDMHPTSTSADEFKKSLKDVTDENGVIDYAALRLHVNNLRQPVQDTSPHESNFLAPETRELDPADWAAEGQ